MRLLVLSLLLTSSFVAQASPEKPTDAELNDWMTFLRSISLPVTTEVCTPLLAGPTTSAADPPPTTSSK